MKDQLVNLVFEMTRAGDLEWTMTTEGYETTSTGAFVQLIDGSSGGNSRDHIEEYRLHVNDDSIYINADDHEKIIKVIAVRHADSKAARMMEALRSTPAPQKAEEIAPNLFGPDLVSMVGTYREGEGSCGIWRNDVKWRLLERVDDVTKADVVLAFNVIDANKINDVVRARVRRGESNVLWKDLVEHLKQQSKGCIILKFRTLHEASRNSNFHGNGSLERLQQFCHFNWWRGQNFVGVIETKSAAGADFALMLDMNADTSPFIPVGGVIPKDMLESDTTLSLYLDTFNPDDRYETAFFFYESKEAK